MAWELKRPEVEPLTEIPQLLRQAVTTDASGDDNQCLKHKAVMFCINDIVQALTGGRSLTVASKGALGSQSGMIEWMKRLTPSAVLRLHDGLREKLTTANGWIVAFNPVLAAISGSSTNAILLGNKQQSASALFYVVPYVCKNKVQLTSTLTALEKAQAHVAKNPSTASDSGTAKRNVQHMLTRCINDLSRSAKISETQVALSLLDFPMEITSDSYGYFGGCFCANHVQNNLKKLHIHTDFTEPAINASPESEDEEDQDPLNHTDDIHENKSAGFPITSLRPSMTDNTIEEQSAHRHNTRWKKKEATQLPIGPAPFYETMVDGKKASLPVHYPVHWFKRGKDLRNVTAAEYFACFEIKKLPKKKEKQTPPTSKPKRGRPSNKHFLFHPSHPLHKTHGQFIRSKQRTLIINGHPPKRPPDPPEHPGAGSTAFEIGEFKKSMALWLNKANAFAFYHMTLYLPQPNMFGEPLPTDLKFTWETFCSTIKEMEHSHLLIDRLRIRHMFRAIDGIPSNYKLRTLLSNYRHRCTTRWTEAEKEEAFKMFSNCRREQFKNDDTLEMSEVDKIYSDRVIKDALHENRFCSNQLRSVRHVFKSNSSTASDFNSEANSNPTTEPNMRLKPKPRKIITLNTALTNDIDNIAKVIKEHKFSNNDVSDSFDDQEEDPLEETISEEESEPSQEESQWQPMKPGSLKRNRDGHLIAPEKALHSYIGTRGLNEKQLNVVQHFGDHFLRMQHFKTTHDRLDFELLAREAPPPKVLLTGDPGSGKSYVIETIQAMAEILQIGHVASASYNGMAAVNIDGSTICRLFSVADSGLSSKHSISEENIDGLRLTLDADNMCCAIIDEVSTIDSKILALVSFRLQQITMNHTLPFGGIPILFVGDFNQLGPVKKTHLATDMMRWAAKVAKLQRQSHISQVPPPEEPTYDDEDEDTSHLTTGQRARRLYLKQRLEEVGTSRSKEAMEVKAAARFQPHTLHYHGCHLFAGLIRFHLEEQVRAGTDEQHSDMVKRLSLGSPMTPSDIDRMKHITAQDLQGDEAHLWKFAPILVSTNRERLNITREKCRIWAIEHNTHVYKWRCIDTAHVNRPTINDYESIVNSEAFFWQFWVPGAPAHLGHNVNPGLALVNGAPVTTHSLTFSDKSEFTKILDLLEGPNPPPFGSEIEIKPPLSLNMKVTKTLDGKPLSQTRSKQLKKLKALSLHDMGSKDEIIIPFTKSMCRGGTSESDKFKYPTGDVFVPVAEVSLRPVFPFELAFSVTIHKAQGRTLKRVIVDLTQHPCSKATMEFAAVFVAQSRVKKGDHMRLLKHSCTLSPFDKDKAYGYLMRLRPMTDTMALYHGYVPSTTTPHALEWNLNVALSYDG